MAVGDDYEETTQELTFTPTSPSPLCVDVIIEPNDILEGIETFSAQLTPTDEITVINNPNTAVTIMDDDSK